MIHMIVVFSTLWLHRLISLGSGSSRPRGFGLKLANNFWPGFLQPTPMLLQLCKVRCGYNPKPARFGEFEAISVFEKFCKNCLESDLKMDESQ